MGFRGRRRGAFLAGAAAVDGVEREAGVFEVTPRLNRARIDRQLEDEAADIARRDFGVGGQPDAVFGRLLQAAIVDDLIQVEILGQVFFRDEAGGRLGRAVAGAGYEL